MNRLERIPKVRDSITEGEYRFTVKDMQNHHVQTVVIEKIEANDT